jgi:hypothetical protein
MIEGRLWPHRVKAVASRSPIALATAAGHAGIALDHGVLHFDGAANRIDDAAEFDDRPSPVRLTMRPLCTAIVGSIKSLRSALSRARIRSSSAAARRL